MKNNVTQPTYTTSELSREIGFNVSSQFLLDLGFSPVYRGASMILWSQSDLPIIMMGIAKEMITRSQKVVKKQK